MVRVAHPLTVLWLRKKKNEKMVFNAVTSASRNRKGRTRDPTVHARAHELDHNNNSGDRRGDYDNNLRVSLEQVEWGQYNPYLRYIRRNSRFRFGLQHNNCWFGFHFGNRNKSSQPSTGSDRDRKRNRHYFYYGLIISLLTIGVPTYAEEGETNNTSNPVAAATGNVTNQAVQFQNNGAPSRQVYGPNISCNGSTMTFSPFYMGNHTTPFDEEMAQQSYTVAENWGFQVNFMIPLDQEGLKRCRSIAARQQAKMELDYELVRVLKCGELQQKGFMLVPGSRVYHMCSDVIPIASWLKAQKKVEKCTTPPKPWYKPWQKPKLQCPNKK